MGYTGHMKTLREYIADAEARHTAIGHFNFSNLEALHAIFAAARELSLPVIAAVSEGEEDFVGTNEAVALVKALRNTYDYPIFLDADHHYSFERVKRAVDAGFDAVIIDGAQLPFEKNVALAKQCVAYARDVMKQTGRDILVEGELGFIGVGSSVKDTIPEGAVLTTDPALAAQFVRETGVDLLAPAVGSVHGLIRSGKPHVNAGLVQEIRAAAGVPLVLHGGSGLTDEDFRGGIEAGISIVHINTELRLADRNAVEKSLKENPNEVAPYKFLASSVEDMTHLIKERMKLFAGIA